MIGYFVYNLNNYSGAAKQALMLAKNLDMPITIFNHQKGQYSKNKINDKLNIVNLPSNKLVAFALLIYFVFRMKIRLIHLHGVFKHSVILKRIFRAKIILKTTLVGEDDFDSLKSMFRNDSAFERYLDAVDLNICLTNQLRIINESYLDEKKVKVIPNGVEVNKSVVVRKKDNVFCIIGVVCERKGTYEAIEYFINNYSSLPRSKLYVIGPLSNLEEADKEYVKKCTELVARHPDKTIVFTGKLSGEEICQYYQEAKVLIFFSKREGMPNVFLEAIAHNCFPISTGIGGVSKEILGEELDKIATIKSKDVVVDIDLIEEVIESGVLQRLAQEHFSITAVSNEYKKVYEKLTTDKSPIIDFIVQK